MFKFNFQEVQTLACVDCEVTPLKEVSGKEIIVSSVHNERATNFPKCIIQTADLSFQLVDCKHVEHVLGSDQAEGDVQSAIKLKSDVIKGVYEGGLKIWECTLDLISYLDNNQVNFTGQKVIDLGCGAGLLGIHALRNGASSVHFQDYNHEVIDYITAPNVLLNSSPTDLSKQCQYFSGDWRSLHSLLDKYDTILTSETIYNPENYCKLLAVFDQVLKAEGSIYVAAKTQYFGVGGNLRQFEKLINDQKIWKIETCFCSEEGVRREIIKLSRSG